MGLATEWLSVTAFLAAAVLILLSYLSPSRRSAPVPIRTDDDPGVPSRRHGPLTIPGPESCTWDPR